MFTKGILSHEDYSESSSSDPLLSAAEADADLELQEEAIDEAEDIDGMLEGLQRQAETAAQNEAGLSEGAAQAMEQMVRYCALRLSASSVSFPALEQFTSATRQQQTIAVRDSLISLRRRLDKSLTVAQEGFFDSIVDTFQTYRASEASIRRKLDIALAEFQDGHAGEIIEKPIWGRWIPQTGSGTITSNDALIIARTIAGQATDEGAQAILELKKMIEQMTVQIRGIWFISDEKDIARIKALRAKIRQIVRSSQDALQQGKIHSPGEGRPNFEKMSRQQAHRLSDLVHQLLNDRKVLEAYDDLSTSHGTHTLFGYINSGWRLKHMLTDLMLPGTGGMLSTLGAVLPSNTWLSEFLRAGFTAEDLAVARQGVNEALHLASSFRHLAASRIRILNAIVSYSHASGR